MKRLGKPGRRDNLNNSSKLIISFSSNAARICCSRETFDTELWILEFKGSKSNSPTESLWILILLVILSINQSKLLNYGIIFDYMIRSLYNYNECLYFWVLCSVWWAALYTYFVVHFRILLFGFHLCLVSCIVEEMSRGNPPAFFNFRKYTK